jgi:hypothetical protein
MNMNWKKIFSRETKPEHTKLDIDLPPPQEKLLRVWWNSNHGQPAFTKEIKNVKEAKYIINLLTQYDLYLGDKIISNACGLEVLYMNEWIEWEDEEGRSITELMDMEMRK